MLYLYVILFIYLHRADFSLEFEILSWPMGKLVGGTRKSQN